MMAKRARAAGTALTVALVAALAVGIGVARAESPIPLKYTWFGDPPTNAENGHWFAVFDDQTEVALRGRAFAAHLSIDRTASRERDEFAAYYAPRMCRDLGSSQSGRVSKCPARLLRYRDGAQISADQVADVCLVHKDARPPSPLDVGWNASQATLRVINGAAVLVISAVLGGQLIPDCTVFIPLPPAT